MTNLTDVSFSFWKGRYDNNESTWHRSNISPFLINNWNLLNLKENSKLLFPLCGKSLDMTWVLSQGHIVVGIDCCEEPVQTFFNDNKIEPIIESYGNYKLYKSLDSKLRIYVQDIFAFQGEEKEKFNAIIDRGALTAMKISLRQKYIEVLTNHLDDDGHILFETLEYDQSKFSGPPFSVSATDMINLAKDNNLRLEVLHRGIYEKKMEGVELHDQFSLASKLK